MKIVGWLLKKGDGKKLKKVEGADLGGLPVWSICMLSMFFCGLRPVTQASSHQQDTEHTLVSKATLNCCLSLCIGLAVNWLLVQGDMPPYLQRGGVTHTSGLC